jgi:prophage DNA circulation protein
MIDCGNEFGTASFRGIEFEIMPSQYSGGRRILTHTYPFSDEHYNEDLGDNPLKWSIKGRFVGENFRDQLTKAGRVWRDGEAGDFFEPTENKTHEAVLVDWSYDFDNKRLNAVDFSLELIERSKGPYPSSDNASRGSALNAQEVFLDAVEKWYVESPFTRISDVFSGIESAKNKLLQLSRIHLRIGGYVRTVASIVGFAPSRNRKKNVDSARDVFENAIDADTDIGFYRASSEIRTSGVNDVADQGTMTSLVGLAYYFEKATEGTSYAEIANFRARALDLKVSVDDFQVSNQIDNLILELGRATTHECWNFLAGTHHALVASYQLYGNIGNASNLLDQSGGISGSAIDQVAYPCALG